MVTFRLGATQAKVGNVGGAKSNAVHRLVTELTLLMSLAIVQQSRIRVR